MKAAVVYPRGFLGFDIGLPAQKEHIDLYKVLNAVRYNGSLKQNNKVSVSNTAVSVLYRKLIQDAPGLASYPYREQVLKTALKAFGTDSFYDWCQLQKESPFLSDLHIRFLNDTFRFIQTGERMINLINWDRLIQPVSINAVTHPVHYEYREFFQLDQAALFRRPFTTTAVIQSWVSQPNGLIDLISTLRILFCDLPVDTSAV